MAPSPITPHHTTPLLTTSLPRATMPRTGGSKKRKRASGSKSPKKRKKQKPAVPRSQRKEKGQCRCGSTERKLITHGSCRLNKKNQSEVGGGCLPVCDLPIPSVVRSIACQSQSLVDASDASHAWQPIKECFFFLLSWHTLPYKWPTFPLSLRGRSRFSVSFPAATSLLFVISSVAGFIAYRPAPPKAPRSVLGQRSPHVRCGRCR